MGPDLGGFWCFGCFLGSPIWVFFEVFSGVLGGLGLSWVIGVLLRFWVFGYFLGGFRVLGYFASFGFLTVDYWVFFGWVWWDWVWVAGFAWRCFPLGF